MKYKAIFFDADGVMIKSKYLFSERLEMDYGITKEKMTPFFTGRFRLCTIGQADLKEELSKVVDDWGWKGTVDELLEYWFTKGSEIDKEILQYVEELSATGLRVFMATDQEKYRGEYLRKSLGDGKVFERVFYAAALGVPKKTEEFWSHVLETTNLSKEELLFIDDDLPNVEAVQGLGIDSYLYTNLDDLKKKLA